MTKSSVFIFPIVAVFSLLFLTSNAFAQSGSPCNAHLSGSAPSAGYGAGWNPLTSAKELLLSATCTTAGAPVSYTVGVGTATHYVYKVGYVYAASWQPCTMTGTFAQGSTDWLSGRGTYTNPSPPATDYFWVGYICQWPGSERKCGRRDAACATNYWQLQQVKYPVPGGTTGGRQVEVRVGGDRRRGCGKSPTARPNPKSADGKRQPTVFAVRALRFGWPHISQSGEDDSARRRRNYQQ